MFKNFIIVAIRNIQRNKAFSTINITGLAVGLAVSLVIAFYVIDDLTFDRFHEKSEDIYRMLTLENAEDDSAITYSITAGPLMAALEEGIPEVTAAARTFAVGRNPISADPAANFDDPGVEFLNVLGIITDPDFFRVFSFEILTGEGPQVLENPGAVLLTPQTAEALFGAEDPVGKTLRLPQIQNAYCAGIVEAPPQNSHIQFEAIGALRPENNPVWWDSWENLMLSGYMRLAPGSNPIDVEQKIIKLARDNHFADVYLPQLQPLLDVHLGSGHHRYDGFNTRKNVRSVVYSLAVIGILILVIAAINFINLSTARATQRAREVGLRKVVGSDRLRLIIQFLLESVVLTFLAMIIAVIILELSMPYLNNLLGKNLEMHVYSRPKMAFMLFGLAVIIGLLSGFYPAMILSGFRPTVVLKGRFKTSVSGVLLRRVLVVLQFTATIALIAAVLIVLSQIRYLKSIDMGYNRDHVIAVPSRFDTEEDLFSNELRNSPRIQAAGRTSNLPGPNFLRIEVIPEGVDREHSRMFQQLVIDDGYLETLGIKLQEGRNFNPEFQSDLTEGIIINETAMKIIGWENAVGRRMDLIGADGVPTGMKVVGVVKDFHFTLARQSLEPLLFTYNPAGSPVMLVKSTGDDQESLIAEIEEIYTRIFPQRPFNHFFLDDIFDRQFNQDRRFAQNITFFSVIAIFIACLGLFGLVSFTVGQKRQEIAVRKVLGSSSLQIVQLLAFDFLRWVLLANVLAWPLSYFGMKLYLKGFVYQMPFSVWSYIIAGLTILIIAMLTLSYQAVRASLANPVNSLKYE